MPRLAWIGLLLVLAAAIALVGVPIYLLWPFKPQGPSFVPWAWTLRREWAPAGTAVLAAILVGGLYVGWKRTRWPGRAALSLMAIVGVAVAWFAHQNHFEWMFNPIAEPTFDVGAKAPALDPDDLVLGVVIKDDAVAFPVRRIGYHHVVNVTVGGEPIVASYCTLCHTGTIFSRRLNGMLLTFRLIGINNQNAMLEDLESRSWWQQASGEAVAGPLTGMRLTPLLHDEVTYALWAREHPDTKVLARVDPEFDIDKGWEDRMDKVRTVVPAPAERSAAPPLLRPRHRRRRQGQGLSPHQPRPEQLARQGQAADDLRRHGSRRRRAGGGAGRRRRRLGARVRSPSRGPGHRADDEVWLVAGAIHRCDDRHRVGHLGNRGVGPDGRPAARAHSVDDGVLVRLAAASPGYGGAHRVAAAAGQADGLMGE